MEIVKLKNRDPEFYSLMGPFLARRDVEKEIGYRIYDDDNKEWFVARESEDVGGDVIGFCYRQEKPKGTYQIGSCYVVDAHRSKGALKKLLMRAMSGLEGTAYLTTKNEHLKKVLVEMRFAEVGRRGSFTRYGKEL